MGVIAMGVAGMDSSVVKSAAGHPQARCNRAGRPNESVATKQLRQPKMHSPYASTQAPTAME